MNANSWREVGIELNLMKKNDKERITKRDNNTANKLNKVLSKKKNEQGKDTSVDELSSRFNKQMKF